MEDKKEKRFNFDLEDIEFFIAIIFISIGSFIWSTVAGFIITGGVLLGWLALTQTLKVLLTRKR